MLNSLENFFLQNVNIQNMFNLLHVEYEEKSKELSNIKYGMMTSKCTNQDIGEVIYLELHSNNIKREDYFSLNRSEEEGHSLQRQDSFLILIQNSYSVPQKRATFLTFQFIVPLKMVFFQTLPSALTTERVVLISFILSCLLFLLAWRNICLLSL